MTEDDARAWIVARHGEKAIDRLTAYGDLLVAANEEQNLVAPSTIATLWSRHLVDSAQLIDLASENGLWVDVGSGAGLPGLVVALLTERPVLLVEPRRLRVEFLLHCRDALGLGEQVGIVQAKAQNASIDAPASVISARAVARLDLLFDATRHLGDARTVYVLPKGISAQSELATAKPSWHGVFHVKHSVIDPESGIVVATGVSQR